MVDMCYNSIASIFFNHNLKETMMMYPLAIAGVCTLASIIGTYFVRLGKNQNIMMALYKGFFVSAILSAILLYFITSHVVGINTVFSVGVPSSSIDKLPLLLSIVPSSIIVTPSLATF